MPKTVNKDFTSRRLSPGERADWDRFVDTSPEGSLFSKARYLDLLGARFDISVVEQRGTIVGGIVQSRNAFGVHSNPLFAKYLGILHAPPLNDSHKTTSRDIAVDALLIETIPRHQVWSYTFSPKFQNWLGFHWAGFNQTIRYTYRLAFVPGYDWRRGYDKKLNWAIRRAEHDGLEAEPVQPPDLAGAVQASFADLKKHLPLSRARLDRIIETLTESGDLACLGVRDKFGKLLCAAGILQESRCCYLLFNGMPRLAPAQGANALLVDRAIAWASKRSECFDFEGSMYPGIERFYRRFGGGLTPYFAIYRGNAATAAYRWAEKTARRVNG